MVPTDPAYYSTVAQVIPTLLLAAAVEYRVLADTGDRHALEVSRIGRLSLASMTMLAVVGEFVAVDALYNGAGERASRLTLAGLMAALLLVLAPLLIRAVASPIDTASRRTYFVENVLPAGLCLLLAYVLVTDI